MVHSGFDYAAAAQDYSFNLQSMNGHLGNHGFSLMDVQIYSKM